MKWNWGFRQRTELPTPDNMGCLKATFLLLMFGGYAGLLYWFYINDAAYVPHILGGDATKRLRQLVPPPWPRGRVGALAKESGDVGGTTDVPIVTSAPSNRVPKEYASGVGNSFKNPDGYRYIRYVINRTWIKWTETDNPASYRACVPRPKDSVSMSEVVTGGLVERSSSMTIIHCVWRCIAVNFTYAALSRGTECFCSAVQGESPLLTYTENTHCDTPCSGQPRYNCGGKGFMSLYRTSVPDPRCPKAELRPRGSLPLTALASYPRSGNTWTRQLIERATGILTGSVYWEDDKTLTFYKTLFPGGNINFRGRRTICAKTHRPYPPHIWAFERTLLLIRNPYHALVAELFRRKTIQHGNLTVAETVLYFNSSGWKEFAEEEANKWKNTTVNWINYSRRIHVAHYENLRENTYEELAKIVRFLGVPVQKERLLCATQEHPSSKLTGIALGNYGEKTRLYLTEDPFPPGIRKLIDENIKLVNATLLQHNLTSLPRDYFVEVF